MVPFKREPPRAPLLWVLLPSLPAFAFAPSFHPSWAFPAALIGTVCLLCAGIVHKCRPAKAAFLMRGSIVLASIFLAVAWYHFRVPSPDSDWERLPAREFRGEVQISRLIERQGESPFLSGYGKIVRASGPLAELIGQRVYFHAYTDLHPHHFGRGATIVLRGVLNPIRPPVSPFFDYLTELGIRFHVNRARIARMESPPPAIIRVESHLRRESISLLRADEPDDGWAGAVYAAMLLGNRSLLDEAAREHFVETGTMHFFAISGLHVMAVAVTLNYALLLLRLPPRFRVIAGLLLLLFYVRLTGAAPSAIRAYLMVLFFWSARAIQRQPNSLAALTASALTVLLVDPVQVFNAGFRLSYTVVAALLFYAQPLFFNLRDSAFTFSDIPERDWSPVQKAGRHLWGFLSGLFAVSIAAFFASAPFTIAFFELYTPGGILLNVFLAPLITLVVNAGILSLLFGFAGLTGVSTLFNNAGYLILEGVRHLLTWIHGVPGTFVRESWVDPLLPVLAAALFLTSSAILGHLTPRVQKWALPLPPLIVSLVFFAGT